MLSKNECKGNVSMPLVVMVPHILAMDKFKAISFTSIVNAILSIAYPTTLPCYSRIRYFISDNASTKVVFTLSLIHI